MEAKSGRQPDVSAISPEGRNSEQEVIGNHQEQSTASNSLGILKRIRHSSVSLPILNDVVSVYGVQLANYVFPLATVPYLSRVLGPTAWGLTAMAQAFGMYGHLIVEYGFVLSATRNIAQASSHEEIERVVAGVSGARLLLIALVLSAAFLASRTVPLFRAHQLLLWAAVISEALKAALPNYFFYGLQQVRLASLLDIAARTASLMGLFFFVKRPEHAWRFFALQAVGALVALTVAHWLIFSRYRMRLPRSDDGLRMLREGLPMFFFRSSHNLYVLGNAFLLGLFAPAQTVGYYAGAEKINSAAVGMLSPLSTVLYPRSVHMVKTGLSRAARLTVLSVYVLVAASGALALTMWFGSHQIIRFALGPGYGPAENVLKVLALRAPLVAWTNVLGFQWLLALGLETPFQWVTVAALALNFVLAALLAPRFASEGMSWAVVLSQLVVAFGIFGILQQRRLNPFKLQRNVEAVPNG